MMPTQTKTPRSFRLVEPQISQNLDISEQCRVFFCDIMTLRAWSSKLKPPASSEALSNSRWSLFSAIIPFDSLEEDLSAGTSIFDHPIKANQLGPDLVKIYLLLDYHIWNISDVCNII